jgi:hypothetical protein
LCKEEKKVYIELEIERTRIEEALWWFEILQDQKEKLNSLEAQLKQREGESIV